MKLTFWGAARTVTGSMHLLELADGRKLLLDCGLFQGRRYASLFVLTLPAADAAAFDGMPLRGCV